MAGDADWMAQVREAALEPDLPIVDPHHHLWDHPGSRYLLDELLADTGSGHNIVATVFMECASMYRADGPVRMQPVGETEFVNGIAAMSASGLYGKTRACAAIVGFADLTLGDEVAEVLDAHLQAAPDRFRGIRHAAGWDSDDRVRRSHTNPREGLLLDATFRRGYAQLGRFGMSFDSWLYHPQIPELTDLARAFPDIPVIFDHFGGPLGIGPYEGKRDEIFVRWKKDVAELAKCPNVNAKLGGINMAVNGYGWHKQPKPPTSQALTEATRDWYLHMIEMFGPERCMFESNFPVDKLSCSYTVLWNSFKQIAAGFSAADRTALFSGTASRVYRLPPFT